MSAKASGMSEEVFENYDEKPTNSLLYSLSMGTYAMGNTSSAYINLPIHHKVFLAQFDTIKSIGEKKEGGVIVGRCADYALANYPTCERVHPRGHQKTDQEDYGAPFPLLQGSGGPHPPHR